MLRATTSYFEDQLLPSWARRLDLAARLGGVPTDTQKWFAEFCRESGEVESEVLKVHADRLLEALRNPERVLLVVLQRTPMDRQPGTIIAAWRYSLETMLQQASQREECSWRWAEGEADDEDDAGSGGGEVTLRRV
jgi:hypothetical protein